MFPFSQANDLTSDRRPRAILVIAHPGHELRVHGWLEQALPDVWVLTDGSGRTEHSRIHSTTRVLEASGAVPGLIYGHMSDIDLYNAVLNFDHRRFTELVDELANALMRDDVEYLAGDAEEGYNPGHDVCRLVINAAIRVVKRKTGKQIANYDFTLVGERDGRCPEKIANSLWLHLDDAQFARKLAAARNYPELQAEVASALNAGNETFREHPDLVERSRSTYGVTDANHFRVECLRPVNAERAPFAFLDGDIPFYEAYGEKQVGAGNYTQVLRYREHMLPLAEALDSHAERSR